MRVGFFQNPTLYLYVRIDIVDMINMIDMLDKIDIIDKVIVILYGEYFLLKFVAKYGLIWYIKRRKKTYY